ncbi:MAG TPA: glycosyltransferase family 1 protein [Syntrophales bacterium]|nr:glycosyltransferase family 1 protein [Syntrophales bacterium]
MRIAVNARMLSQRRPGGIGRYSLETLKRITERHREHDFLFIVDRPFSRRKSFPDNVSVTRIFPSFHPLLWYPWFEWAVPPILKRFGADLFLSTDGFASLRAPVPTAVAIHDLSFRHHPGDMPPLHRRYFNHFFPKYAKKAKVIVTVSEYSKRDIAAVFGEPSGKITVTGNGVSDLFFPLPEGEREKARSGLTGGAPYFLSVGLLHPRKNLVRMIEAFERFRNETPTDAKLVLAGPRLFKTEEIYRTWNRIGHKRDVLFLGMVPEERLAGLYGGARAFLLVSTFEGFGIPALEAMACGVPVIASNRTSLPEICGDAALLVDPYSVASIAGAMKAVFFDDSLRGGLVAKAMERRKRFSWDRAADLLWEAAERAMA